MSKSVLWLLFTASVFATNFVAIKVALAAIPPLWLAELRLLLGALGLWVVLWLRGEHRLPWGELGLTSTVATLGFALPFVLIAWAETRLSSAATGLLFCAGPLIAAAFSHFMAGDDRLNARKVLGLLVGGLASAALYWGAAVAGPSPSPFAAVAILATLVCFAISGNLSRRIRSVTSTVLTARALTLAAVVLLPIAVVLERPIVDPAPRHWAALAYSGLLATSVGYALRYWLIKIEGYTFVAFLGYLMPPLSGLWGFVLLGEVVAWQMWLAAFGALGGIAIARSRV